MATKYHDARANIIQEAELNRFDIKDELAFSFARIGGKRFPTLKRRQAYHEAGHALAYYVLFGRIIAYVSVASPKGHCPICRYSPAFKDRIDIVWSPGGYDRASIEDKTLFDGFLVSGYAGSAAEAHLLGVPFNDVAQKETDYYENISIARHVFNMDDNISNQHLGVAINRAIDLVADPAHWRAIEALANALIVERVIVGDRATDILRDALGHLGSGTV